MSEAGLIQHSLTEFFREILQAAFRTHEVQPSESTEHYLVTLLERFAKPAPDWNDRPLALAYLEAFHQPRPHRCASLRRVGDTALFLSGVFMEHLERRAVSTDYYIALGRIAYQQLASLAPTGAASRADVFAEIAAGFPDFVRVLSEVNFSEMFRDDAQTARIYTRWLRTRGAHDVQWLLRRGLVPYDPNVKSRH
ncbi:MAG: hypothetical protein ABI629_16190 [bacterium]